MKPEHEIRADYDRDTLVVYQAYSRNIAVPALAHGRFVEPFSFQRMTWIKPSFLWLMHRSQWAQKSGQEHILAIRITRRGWEQALASAVLSVYSAQAHRSKPEWADAFAKAPVHVQWDPERNIRGAALPHGSIQVGISRDLIRDYNENWIVEIRDLTPLVAKMRDLIRRGEVQAASRHLPPEKPYPVTSALGRHLLLGTS
ncbi:DUF4291 domain-containing protein [Brevifollis gellanilyticus]|uniref:DUF4291 domain-containing protein n=1 Tax=Brevifollis gellanilyticus TaxID=748831 RepID=A0A512MAT6_9BACT|nr:DUF4291 domain-containing protein [Brevifollis gellanilyticus]GEP43838.1 hypothetical protein BGE01nite_31290 [Brevifollis gellanilyticus]